MPRFNNEGQTARFLDEMADRNQSFRGGRGGYYGRGHGRGAPASKVYRDFDDVGHNYKSGPRRGTGHVTFNFTSEKSHSIMRKPKSSYVPVDDDGDIRMDGNAPGASSMRDGKKFIEGRRGISSHRGKKWRALKRDQDTGREEIKPSYSQTWNKIMITNGSQYPRDLILQSLSTACPIPFRPIGYAVLGLHAVFFVEDKTQAEAIYNCSRDLKAPDGSRINIRVTGCGTPPSVTITPAIEEKVRAVLASRYNAAIPSLTLENFGMSPEISMEYYFPIFRPVVMSMIFRLLESALPTLAVLDLSNNKLVGLDNFATLPKKTPNLRALNVAHNRISDAFQFDKLKGLELHELNINNNPLLAKYEDKEKLTSFLRKVFPKLAKLDGIDLGPQISFDVEDTTKLPSTLNSYFCNEAAKKVVLTFVEQYIQLYDSDDRQPLLAAYHDSAVMTLCSANTKDHCYGGATDPATRLHKYVAEARNLIRLNDKTRKYKLLRIGKLDIVAFLTKLPKTLHDTSSLIIDMPIAMESFITFSVFGVFRERDEKEQLIRSFQRTFNLVPQNSGFSIVNEMLHVQNPTNEQFKNAFKGPAPTPSPSPVPYVQPVDPSPSTSVAIISDSFNHLTIPSTSTGIPSVSEAETRKQMVIQFSQQSSMNAEWSQKCLEENGWNYEASGRVFTELHKLGRIPPEAFVK